MCILERYKKKMEQSGDKMGKSMRTPHDTMLLASDD